MGQVQAVIDLGIPEKVLPLLTKPKRIKILVGGRGGAKSVAVADIMAANCAAGKRIGCGREFQNSIDDSVHNLISGEISRLGIPGIKTLANRISSAAGGEIFYKGLARNPESLKSMAALDYFWVEEAETISDRTLKLLTPSVRSRAGSPSEPEIWFTMNRRSSADPIAQKYLKRAEPELARCGYYEDDLMIVIQINYTDNPWFPPELERERLDDKANLPLARYRHIWEGDYNDDIENSIIPVEWFEAAIDAHIKLGKESDFRCGKIVASHDPSDLGNDSKGLAIRHGSLILDVLSSDSGDINEGCDWAISNSINSRVEAFVWDGDGMGVGLRRQVSEGFNERPVDQIMFRGSATPDHPDAIYNPVDGQLHAKTNKDTFRNKRAQYYWALRDRFYATYQAVVKGRYMDPDKMISLSSDIECIDQLRSELCRIPLKPNSNGLIQIMSKPELLKLSIPSPNMADAIMMSLAITQQQTTVAVIPRPISRMRR